MHRPHIDSNFFFFFFFFLFLLYALRARADVGTAALYGPPYLPTACFGGDSSQFPPNNLFAAAGEGIWDNGASCGREYLVRCLSSAVPGACADDGLTIQVTVVDQADGLVNSSPSTLGTTLVLSRTAFAMIAGLSAAEINIEFIEYATVFSPGYWSDNGMKNMKMVQEGTSSANGVINQHLIGCLENINCTHVKKL